MSNLAFSLMDAFALACVALDKRQNDAPLVAAADTANFNIFVTDENGIRTLVRENLSATLSSALVHSANDGAKIQGLRRTYEIVPVGT